MSDPKPSERWFVEHRVVEHMGSIYPEQYVYIGGERVHENGDRSCYCVGQIDVCHRTEEARREAYRKAHLAASAPDLLAACKAILHHIDAVGDDTDLMACRAALVAAIDKAEGGAQ